MTLGVPTIVFSDGGGLVEHIEDGQTGYIVDDEAGLERTLRILLANPSLRSAVGARGKREMTSRYTLEKSAAAYDQLYYSILPATSSVRHEPLHRAHQRVDRT
jgi:glycosyltransferase involved in cell wall biosynthesis